MERLTKLLQNFEYSSYYSFKLPVGAGFMKPPYDIKFENGCYVPQSPAGYTLGNEEIFAAIGVPLYTVESIYEYYTSSDKLVQLSSPTNLSLLIGPNKQFTHMKVLLNQFSCQDFVLTYKKGKKQVFLPFWECPIQYNLRVKQTPIIVASLRNSDLLIKVVSFAPRSSSKKEDPLIARMIYVKNLGSQKLTDIRLFTCFLNKGSNWRATISSHCVDITPTGQNPGFSCFSPEGFDTILNSDEFDEFDELFDLLKEEGNIITNLEDSEDIDAESETQHQSEFENLAILALCSSLGDLDSIEATVFNMGLLTAPFESTTNLDEVNRYSKSYDFEAKLKETYEEEIKWTNEVGIHTSDEQLNDLIDSILSMMRIHEGSHALHLGSLVYDHNSAFVRDNYYVQRAYNKAGRSKAALKNWRFFENAFEQSGFSNSYSVSGMQGHSSAMEMRVETPAYFPLMCENMFLWTKNPDFPMKAYPILKSAMKTALSCPNHLFILNSDETWIWPSYVNEIDYYIDNSFLMGRAADFTYQLSKNFVSAPSSEDFPESQQPLSEFAQSLRTFRNNILDSLWNHYHIGSENRFALGLDHNGFQDCSLVPSLVARPTFLNMELLLESAKAAVGNHWVILNGLNLIWDTMQKTGCIRSHSRTTAFAGNTIGYYLYAVSNYKLPFQDALLDFAINAVDCTGSLYEVHDMYAKPWGTEKQRFWDTLSLLEGLLHYLYGIEPAIDYIRFNPCPPRGEGFSWIKDLEIHGKTFMCTSYSPSSLMELAQSNPEILAAKEGLVSALFAKLMDVIPEEMDIAIKDPFLLPRYSQKLQNEEEASTLVKELYRKDPFSANYEFFVQTNLRGHILMNSDESIALIRDPVPQSPIFIYYSQGEPLNQRALDIIRDYNMVQIQKVIHEILEITEEKDTDQGEREKDSFDEESEITVIEEPEKSSEPPDSKKHLKDEEAMEKLLFETEIAFHKESLLSVEEINRPPSSYEEAEDAFQIIRAATPYSLKPIIQEKISECRQSSQPLIEAYPDIAEQLDNEMDDIFFSLIDKLYVRKCPLLYIDVEQINHTSNTHFNGISIDIIYFERTNEYEIFILNRCGLPLLLIKEKKVLVIPNTKTYNQVGYIKIEEPIEEETRKWTPPRALLTLDEILYQNGAPNLVVFYDHYSEAHAMEIYREMVLLKADEFPHQQIEKTQFESKIKANMDMNILLVAKTGISLVPGIEDYEHIYSGDNFWIWQHSECPLHHLIFVENKNHVYKDTHAFCETLGIYITPRRKKARPMFPYGFFTFLDYNGDDFTDPLQMELDATEPIHLYYNDVQEVTNNHQFTYQIDQKPAVVQGPQKPYLLIQTTTPYAPFEVAAGGLASGAHMMRLLLQADADDPVEITLKVKCHQLTQIVWLNNSQRERVKDPITMEKCADGTKILTFKIHPGRDVHPTIKLMKGKPKQRLVSCILGKYPKW